MRLWQVRFQLLKPIESLPIPDEIVLEIQNSPSYHMEGSKRQVEEGCAQIVTTVSGEGAFRCGNEITRLTPGKTFLAKLCDPETSYYYPGHASEPWVFIWISFYGKYMEEIVDDLNARYGYTFYLPLDKGFVKHLESYKSQDNTFQFLSPTAGSKIVFDALALFGESIEFKDSFSPKAELVRSAQELISANLERELDIAAIAEKLHVSREHLTRVFHAQTGITPGAFATDERMRVARRLLRDNTLTCKEIGERLGYVSATSFARAFKNYHHCSPDSYKNRKGVEA